MKRPAGFDRGREESAASAPRRGAADGGSRAATARAGRPAAAKAAKPGPRVRPPKPSRAPQPADPVRVAKRRLAAERREAQRELARARAARRRYERQEIKRFTVRQRARRAAWWTTVGVVGTMVVLVLIAVFSPILALRQVVVEGTSRVDAEAVRAALESQLDTPLALIDYGEIDTALDEFPIIESYTTETIPPGTMLVRIVERQPIVTVEAPGGRFRHVDAAGVTVEELAERIPGVPLVTESGTSLPNPAFDVAVEVLQAMPPEMRSQVDRITATSRDHVTLWLVGAVQSVEWGSADDSVRKAEVLAQLQAIYGDKPGVFDVSGSETGIFRPV